MSHYDIFPAIDESPSARPGVPAQRKPAPVGRAHWVTPNVQSGTAEVVKDPQRAFRGTFGSGERPSGLSGALRRRAYRIPDYRVKRWALLLLADRVEWAEHGAYARPAGAIVGGLMVAGALGGLLVRRAAR